MKKIIFVLLGLVLIIAGIFIFSVIRSFNVESYKSQIVAQLQQLTGRRVTCAEEASLSWQPRPTFIINDLVISNQDGSETANMFSVKQIQVEMDWSAFLRSSLSIRRVVLKNPSLLLERLHTYQTNFTFPHLFNPGHPLAQDDIIVTGDALRINSFEIQDGTFTYHNDLTKQTLVFHQIQGTGKTDSMDGPFEFDGRVRLGDNDLNVQIKTNRLTSTQPFVSRFSLSDDPSQTKSDFSGIFTPDTDGNWLQLSGFFSSQKPADFAKRFAGVFWPDLGEIKGDFGIDIKAQEIIPKKIIFIQKDGEEDINVVAKTNLDDQKKENFSLTVNQLKYDTWAPLLTDLIQKKIFDSPKERTVNVDIEKLLWHDQVSSDVKIQGDLSHNVLDGTVSAQLPHDSRISAKGQWQLSTNSVKSEIVFQTQNLRYLIEWVLKEKPAWMPEVGFFVSQWTADLDWSDQAHILKIKSANIDDIKISGSVEQSAQKLKTDLKIQDFDADPYYEKSAVPTISIIRQWLKEKEDRLLALAPEGQLALTLQNATLFKQNFTTLIFDGKWNKNGWNITNFSVQKPKDLDIRFSGTVSQWTTPEITIKDGKLEFDIPQWQKWNEQLKITQNNHIKDLTSLSGSVAYTGNLKKGNLNTHIVLDNTEISGQGAIQNPVDEWAVNQFKFGLKNPNFSKMIAWWMPDKKWNNDWDESIELNGQISGNAQQISWNNMDVLLGKNKIKTSGQKSGEKAIIKINASQLNLDMFLPSLNDFYTQSSRPFVLPDEIPDMQLDADVQHFSYSDWTGEQLKFKGNIQQQKMNIQALDCLIGKEKPGRLSVDGSVDLQKGLKPDLRIEWDKIPLNKGELQFGDYRFADGTVSGTCQLKSTGRSWADLINNATGNGQMSWHEGTLYGLDASAWLNTVQSALAAEQMNQGFSSRLQSAFKNGKTTLPDLQGNFKIAKGFLNFSDIHGANDLITVNNAQADLSSVKETTRIKMPVILTVLSQLPPVVLDANYNSYTLQYLPFEQAFDAELRLKNNQTSQARQLQAFKETQKKNQQIRTEAQDILNKMEATLKQLQERVALRSDADGANRLDSLNYTAREIRELAVKTDLTEDQYADLLEKTRLWSAQVKELNNYYARQDLLNQKLKTNQLTPVISNYLANMEQIYQQHPQSVILAEIVMNARQGANLIQSAEDDRSAAQDAQTAQNMIMRIQDNFDKIEKAHQYAQRLHLSLVNGGVGL